MSVFKYSMIPSKGWMNLPQLAKAEVVLNVIDELFFPRSCGQDGQTYQTYMEFVNQEARDYDLCDLNGISFFWNTAWSGGGRNPEFTEKVKKIVESIYQLFYKDGWYGWFMNDCIYFTSHKSRCIEYVCEADGDQFEFKLDNYDQWDEWKFGFIELIIQIVDFVVNKSHK